jgi:hypothetical protein
MIDSWNLMDVEVKSAIISAITSILILILGGLGKIIYERYSLNYKLKKKYKFEQQKKIKDEIAKTKIQLLNSAEEFNSRLWNFKNNLDKGWHSIDEVEWLNEERYYLRSSVFRFIQFIYWIIRTEKSLLSFDSTVASNKEDSYLKFIKTFKIFFCQPDLLKNLDYSNDENTNHFYKNELINYAKYLSENDNVLEYNSFYEKTKLDYSEIKKIFTYFNSLSNDDLNKNYNILMCFHLFLIKFLNEFGHDYQKTAWKKIKSLINDYKRIKIKEDFTEFLKSNKMYWTMYRILRRLNNE